MILISIALGAIAAAFVVRSLIHAHKFHNDGDYEPIKNRTKQQWTHIFK